MRSARRRAAFLALLGTAAVVLGAIGLLRDEPTRPPGNRLAEGRHTPRALAAATRSGPDVGLPPHPSAGGFRPDRTTRSDCGGAWLCLEQAFGNLAYYYGPQVALRRFDEALPSDSSVEADCHRIAHAIGSAALARYDGDVSRAFAEGSASCNSGYYHGILEHALAGTRTTSGLVRVARRLCAGRLVRRTQYLAYQCIHGLGHGLMLQSGYDMPFALSICDRLASRWDRTSCTGGVFMENINGATTTAYGFKTPWLHGDDLIYPCDVVAKRHKLYCYLMLTSRILQANGYDWHGAARICVRVERAWVESCFQSYGRDASGFTRQRPSRILRLCAIAGHLGYGGDCLYGAARDLTNDYANGERAAELCRGAPGTFRGRCFYGIGTILRTLLPAVADLRETCARLARAYARSCLEGAGSPRAAAAPKPRVVVRPIHPGPRSGAPSG